METWSGDNILHHVLGFGYMLVSWYFFLALCCNNDKLFLHLVVFLYAASP